MSTNKEGHKPRGIAIVADCDIVGVPPFGIIGKSPGAVGVPEGMQTVSVGNRIVGSQHPAIVNKNANLASCTFERVTGEAIRVIVGELEVRIGVGAEKVDCRYVSGDEGQD